MKAIIFDSDTSKLQLSREIELLKVCYLIADSLCAAGQPAANISFQKSYKKYSLNKKLQYILLQVASQDYPEKDEYIAQVNEFIILSKKVQNLKRIPPQTFVIIKRSTALYTNWFDSMVLEILEQQQKLGIVDMYSWFEDKVLEFAVLGLSACEERRKREAEINAKELLELLFPKDSNESSILVFPADLFQNHYLTEEEKADLVEKDGVPLKGVNIYDCFTIPNIKSLTSLELKALRGQLSENLKEFREKVDKWLVYCKENDEINIQVEELKKEVISCTLTVQEALTHNEMLNGVASNAKVNVRDFTVYLGIAPVTSIWKYYQEFKVLDDETLDIIKETIASSSSYPEFLPVVCISSCYRNLDRMEELVDVLKAEQLDMTRTKKWISVD